MKIEIKRNYGTYLVVTADNVNIEHDIEERKYFKTEDGKTDYNKAPTRDINTDTLGQFVSVLEDMIYYREAEYNSSHLIERLFEKLPTSLAEELLKKLKEQYIEEYEE